MNASEADYGAKWPKAAVEVTDDLDVLPECHKYPAAHWSLPGPEASWNW